MAELLIKIGDGANYSDGDVLCAFSDRAISCVHAQHICHHKRAKRNQSGLLVRDSLTAAFMDRVSQYRDRAHLCAIVVVGSALGLGCCCLVAHVRGGVGGNELLLFAVAPLSGLFGRYIEKPLTKKLQSILGI